MMIHARAWALAMLAISGLAAAQTPFGIASGNARTVGAIVGGSFTSDLIVLRAGTPGVPLRYGSVVQGSETVDLDGRRLRRGEDYHLDNEAGVVYLMRAHKAGQSLRVSYRYEKGKQTPDPITGSTFSGLPAFQFNVLPVGLNFVFGLGMTERTADGNVLSTDLFGTRNAFNFGASSLNGLMLLGERKASNMRSDFEFRGESGDAKAGSSKFIVQNLKSNLGGGSIEADYQDISSNFSGFSAARSSGMDSARVDQLQKERGLKRFSLAARDVNLGGMRLNQGFRTVNDGSKQIEWRNLGVASNGLKLNYSSQKVDQGFARFADLAEADREQLMREAGLRREAITGEFKQKFGALNFNNTTVKDLNGQGIQRRNIALDTSKVKFSLGDQEVDRGFNRFDSLFEAEKGQWGREAGLKRQWMSLDAAVLGRDSQPIKFAQSSIRGPGGGFKAIDASVGSKGWSLEHSSRKVDNGFLSTNAMADGELDTHNAAIAKMYTRDGYQPRPEDRMALTANHGLSRTWTRLAATPFKDWNASFERLKLDGKTDGAGVDSFKLNGKGFGFSYRDQNIGSGFSELQGLLELERMRLGPLMGMSKRDIDLSMQLNASSRVTANLMNATSGAGSASRNTFSYVDPKLEVSVGRREVGQNFSQPGALVDPEKDLLAALQGFKEQDVKVKWQALKNLSLDHYSFDAHSDSLNQDRYVRNTLLQWKPDSKTNFSLAYTEQKNDDPLQVLFANLTQRMTFSRDLGRLGLIEYLNETQRYEGSQAALPDMRKDYFAFATKLNDKTAVKTEQTRTRFDNGDKEDISANSISTELTKRSGVSVTDVKVDRNGNDRDEKRRNYGFWLDFGKGMRLSYGYARQLIGPTGTMQSQLSMTPGTVGGIQFGGGNYNENRWDGMNTQGIANLQFSSAKPFRLGFLKDVTFAFATDSVSDHTRFARENRYIKADAKLGANSLGYEYKSQIHPNGYRAIDRGFKFVTPQEDKNWIRASIDHKVREMPGQGETVIRNYNVSIRPTRGLELSHQVLANPEEQFRGDVLLGSLTSPLSINRWKLGYTAKPSWSLEATWEEKVNKLTLESSRLGGVTLDLFKTSGSPLSLFYGVEQAWGNVARRTAHRYYLRFDQKPGPNQFLSLFAGNVSYEHTIAEGFHRNNWTLRVDYQIRF